MAPDHAHIGPAPDAARRGPYRAGAGPYTRAGGPDPRRVEEVRHQGR
jgi:hypothetical protein